MGAGPPPLMPTPPGALPQPGPNPEQLKEQLSQLSAQQQTLREQIEQSEKNLSAQREVRDNKVAEIAGDAIKRAKWERLQQMARATTIDVDEMEVVFDPIIKACTKDSISSGKGWIFQKAISHDNNQLIAHYLAFRVTQEDAPFSLKLHLIYLM
jgi:calcium homeostasis ER protein